MHVEFLDSFHSPMPRIAYSMGEPAGIGPDIILQLCQQELLEDVVCIADPRILRQRALDLGLEIALLGEDEPVIKMGQLKVKELQFSDVSEAGKPSVDTAKDVLEVLLW